MELTQKVIRNGVWAASSSYILVAVSFIGNLLLARALSPDEFGRYAFATSSLMFVSMFAGFGSQEAVVQWRDNDIPDFISTAFWITFGVNLALALTGTALGLFLHQRLEWPVGGLIIVLSWVTGLQGMVNFYSAILERQFAYRLLSSSRLASTVISFAVAVLMASRGAGVWALLAREIIATSLVLAVFYHSANFPLRWTFNGKAGQWIYGFGWKMMASRISEVLYGRLDHFLIGWYLGTAILGHYSLAYRLAFLGQQFTQGTVQSLLLSAFAAVQRTPHKLQFGFTRSSYWMWRLTVLIGLLVFLLGEEAVVLIYGAKWEGTGRIFGQLAVFTALLPLHENVKSFLIGSGNINKVIYARLIQLACFIPLIVISTMFGSLWAIMWTVNITLLISLAVMAYAAGTFIDIRWGYICSYPLVIGGLLLGLFKLTSTWITPQISPVSLALQAAVIASAFIGGLVLLENRTLSTELAIVRTGLVRSAAK